MSSMGDSTHPRGPRANPRAEARRGPGASEMPAEWHLTRLKGTSRCMSCPWSQDWRFSNSDTSKCHVDRSKILKHFVPQLPDAKSRLIRKHSDAGKD